MTSSQRDKSRRRQAFKAANDGFLERPCRLSREEVGIIVEDSLGQLGRRFAIHKDLTPAQSEAIEADPPTNPQAFTELLMGLVGVDASGNWFRAMLRIVARHFEGAAARR
ncbi:MAG TPA: hypothetical protein VFF12_00460 [Myxococcaceae bacterium]|nr:hypothetical protein [Myxococcaceae bacterium]